MNKDPEDGSVVDTKKIFTEVASKMLNPAAEELGKGLTTVAQCINLSLEPLKAIIQGYDRIKSYLIISLSEKLSQVPLDKIITPSAHIAVPAIESLKYMGEVEELRDMFSCLLATAMNIDTQDMAHPAFIEVVRQLSANEAKILSVIQSGELYPFLCEALYNDNDVHHAYNKLYPEFNKLIKELNFKNHDHIPTYIGNLARLGVLEIRQTTENTIEEQAYDSYSRIPVSHNEARYEAIYVSSFGQAFIKTCIKK